MLSEPVEDPWCGSFRSILLSSLRIFMVRDESDWSTVPLSAHKLLILLVEGQVPVGSSGAASTFQGLQLG